MATRSERQQALLSPAFGVRIVDLDEVRRFPAIHFLGLPKLFDPGLLAGTVDLGRHEQDFAF